MVQLVFVHGVATRSGPTLVRAVENRNTLFREIAFAGMDVNILSPTWGDAVPSINPKVFGTDEKVRSFSLGAGTGQMGGLAGRAAGAATGGDIAQVARVHATVAIDAVFAEALEIAARERRTLSAEELAAFRRAVEAIETDSAPAHVGSAKTDAELARTLGLTGSTSFGIGSTLAKAVSAVTDRIRNAASTVAFGAVRDLVSPSVGFFLGDVFVYLREGELRSRIRELIRAELAKAWSACEAGSGPMVVVGHSMGGEILIDMLQDPQGRSEEHTSELQSLMRSSYAVFCLKKKKMPLSSTHHR